MKKSIDISAIDAALLALGQTKGDVEVDGTCYRKVKYFFWQIRRWIVMNSMRLIYATVNSKGKVTMKKAGIGKIVTITATAKDGSNKKGTYRIKIMEQLQY